MEVLTSLAVEIPDPAIQEKVLKLLSPMQHLRYVMEQQEG